MATDEPALHIYNTRDIEQHDFGHIQAQDGGAGAVRRAPFS
jgi:hypothetical protein